MKKFNGYWTFERCKEEALKYKYRFDFQKLNNSCYSIAHKKRWLDDICSHMLKKGNRKKRMIYCAIFPDEWAYVGLTFNFEQRKCEHLYGKKKSSIKNHILENNIFPHFIKLTDYVDVDEASILEGQFLKIIKNKGYNILNKSKTGNLGGGILIWTKEKCQEEALKYNSKKEFRKNNKSVISIIYKNHWQHEMLSHMFESRNFVNYWTKETCQKEALKYNTRKSFQLYSGGCYQIARRNGWLNNICRHMILKRRGNGGIYWTKELCHEESLKYLKKWEYQKNSRSSYNSAWKNGWLDEVCLHMK